ncbi:MAG: protease complex subunit PrcB family protein [Methanocellales archaeon]|nr:protease complex subunit PrcB family protein [Methanocellales archaeon]
MKKIILLIGLISILLISGCVTQPSDQEITFENISKGSYSGHNERGDYVIKNSSELDNLWGKMQSRGTTTPISAIIDLPDVNFNDEMVVAVFQGTQSTGGYAIEIIKIVEKENSVEVFVKETSPSPDSLVTQAFTQPHHIVKTKRVDKEVIFIR